MIAAATALWGLAATTAAAQTDLTAGKTPQQLFASDCAACHRSPQGLARGRDPSSVAGFLRDHYTTRPANAGAIAGYLAGVGGTAPAPARQPRQAAGQPGQAVDSQPPARPRQPVPQDGFSSLFGLGDPPAPPPAATPPAGSQQAPPPRRTDRVASAPLERLRPYIAAGDAARPSEDQAPARDAKLRDYASGGLGADQRREAALAGKPSPKPADTAPGRSDPADGERITPTRTGSVQPGEIAPDERTVGTPAPLPANGPALVGTAPSVQSNDDAR